MCNAIIIGQSQSFFLFNACQFLSISVQTQVKLKRSRYFGFPLLLCQMGRFAAQHFKNIPVLPLRIYHAGLRQNTTTVKHFGIANNPMGKSSCRGIALFIDDAGTDFYSFLYLLFISHKSPENRINTYF